MKKYFTTPLYYLNGKPHLGHAYTTILVDSFNRFYKLFGHQTIMLTGTDEHGQKVFEAAKQLGLEPQVHCDKLVPTFKEIVTKCNVNNDIFFRTTDESHKKKVQQILQNLFDKGDIYKDFYTSNYCLPCETYFTDKDLVNGNCPECGRPTTILEEENYFFNMAKYADQLEKHILDNPDFIYPDYRRNEVLGILKKGLNPLCITRKKEKMSWGIEIPFDQDFVTYVWFDALSNYINGIGYLDNQTQFDQYWPTVTHFIAKDILMQHTIYWTTMLLAMGLSLPKNIYIHGWWMSDGKKMSKSFGNVVDPFALIDQYGADSFRFYVLREMSLGQDGNFTTKSFLDRHNTELANDFGNLLNRATHLIAKTFDGVVPKVDGQTAFCADFIADFNKTIPLIEELLYKFELNKLLDEVMRLIRSTNKYLENCAPWQLIKTDKALTGSVLYNALEAFRICSLLLSPVIPQKFEDIKKIFPSGMNMSLKFGALESGIHINKSEPLFPRIEVKAEDLPVAVPKNDGLIDIADFERVRVCTAKILSAENVADSDRLLYCTVDFGHEKRKIVAGIAKFYKPEEVVGLNILAVANLKPAEIRGLKSEGMLLTIKQGKDIKLVTIDKELPLGKKLC